jgi:phosphoribosylformylglycinamidine synthase II
VGIDLDLGHVPQRETGMTAYEMMLSESQERMLVILKPGREPEAEKIFRKWGLDFAVIGITTDTGRLIVRHKGVVEADLPVDKLANSAPLYTPAERPWVPTPAAKLILPEWVPAPNGLLDCLSRMMATEHLCSRRWIWEQYDHTVMGDTIQRPGGDAAVVRVHGTRKGVAVACDVTPRYCLADPVMGTKQAVVETWRNLTAVGADPLAITDNMNFASPERPEVMGQFVGAVEGMKEACTALNYPVVSGNCSLYNETSGKGIPPTPAIGGVGLIPDIALTADIRIKQAGDLLVLIGHERGHLGQSLYQLIETGKNEGAPPPVDLADEIKAGNLVRALIRERKVSAVHDVSDGGLLVAVAEMALAGGIGVELYPNGGKLPPHAVWFGEDQGRYIVATRPNLAEQIADRARLLGLSARIVGRTAGDALVLDGEPALPLASLRAANEAWLPRFMGG